MIYKSSHQTLRTTQQTKPAVSRVRLTSNAHRIVRGMFQLNCAAAAQSHMAEGRGRDVVMHFKNDQATESAPAPAPTASIPSRNIVVAVDLSPESDMAVDWAMSNLLKEGDTVHLFHLVQGVKADQVFATPSGHLVRINNNTADTMDQQVRQFAQMKAKELSQRYQSHPNNIKVPVQTHVMPIPNAFNKAALGQALCDQAEALSAAVVVVASHSKGGLTEFVRGSVADWAVRHCSSPVAILHDPGVKRDRSDGPPTLAQQTTSPRHLLVAVDASEASFTVCQWILDNLYHKSDVIHLLHVVPCLPLNSHMGDFLATPGFETDPEIQMTQYKIAETEAKEWQASQEARYKELMDRVGADYTFDTAVVSTDDPVLAISDYICKRADELSAAAVVLQQHEHSAMYEFFLGSVTRQVSHRCPRPVVVLHSREQPTSSTAVV